MSKNLVFQVDVNLGPVDGLKRFRRFDDMYELSKYQARKFADKVGADYFCLDNCDFLPQKHPIYQRLKFYEFDYDYIFYVDCDAIIQEACPNVFELFKDHRFSAPRDFDWDDPRNFKHLNKLIKIYEAKENYRPFCDGVMIIRRDFLDETRDKWRDYIDAYDHRGFHDQGIMNKMVIETGGTYNELDEDWGVWYRNGRCVDHLSFHFKKVNFDLDKYVLKHGMDECLLKNPKNNFKDLFGSP